MAMDPESYISKVMNPKKRKSDPEIDGEGPPPHPAAKRKSDGASETSKGSVSQEPPTMDLETPSDTHSMSTPGMVTEIPHVRPTHTPSLSQPERVLT